MAKDHLTERGRQREKLTDQESAGRRAQHSRSSALGLALGLGVSGRGVVVAWAIDTLGAVPGGDCGEEVAAFLRCKNSSCWGDRPTYSE